VDVNGAFVSGGNNLIGNGTGATGFTNGNNGDQVGTAGTPILPLLGTLGDNGGPTPTHLPLPGSPAIDAGHNLGAPPSDQRGRARIDNGTIDIGAVETQLSTKVVLQLSVGSSPFSPSPGQSLSLVADLFPVVTGSTANTPSGNVDFTIDGAAPVSAP